MTSLRSSTLLLVATLAGAASAADVSAERFLRQIYDRYVGDHPTGARMDSPVDIKRLFAPGLAGLILKDRASTPEGEVPTLDFDPFVSGQDWQIAKVDISVEQKGDGAAVGTVKWVDREPKAVVLDLVKLKAGWRIREITGTDGVKLSSIFAAAK